MPLPKPYWQSDDGRATLYCGDCLELLPLMESGSVDAVVTDPPYGLDMSGSGEWAGQWAEKLEWDRDVVGGVEKLPAMANIVIIWGGNYYCLPPARGWLLWDKMQDHSSGHAEMAWTNLDQPIRTFRLSRVEAHSRMNKNHPTQKPISLMKWCLSFTPAASIILDPFTGSGTTGVAAIQTGRKFVGIELSERYCEIAARRLAAACCEDGGLFDPKKRAKDQPQLFDCSTN